MQYNNNRQAASVEIERRITALTQQWQALIQVMGTLQAKLADQKKAFQQLSQSTQEFYSKTLHSKELDLQELLENEPAIDERDARAKRQINPYRAISPVERQIEMIKGDFLTRLFHFLICLIYPGFGMVKAVQIRGLRQQARREWEGEVQTLRREIHQLQQSLQFPRYTDEQRSLLAGIASDERELSRLEQQARGKEIEIASLKPLLSQAHASDQKQSENDRLAAEALAHRADAAAAYNKVAQGKLEDEQERMQQNKVKRDQEAKLRQREEEARLIILQAHIDEALARKRAAELMRDLVADKAANQQGKSAAQQDQSSSATGQVLVTEVLVLDSK